MCGAVIALPVTNADQMATPIVVFAVQVPLGAAFCVGGDLCIGYAFGVGVTNVVTQVVTGPVPPPSPINLIDADIQRPAGVGLAVAVQANQVDGVQALTGQCPAPATAFGNTHADPMLERVHRHAANLGAVIATVFKHARGQGGAQHARGLLHIHGERHGGVALRIHIAIEGSEGFAAELSGGVVEVISVVTTETGGARTHPHFHVGVQIGGGGAVKPLGE